MTCGQPTLENMAMRFDRLDHVVAIVFSYSPVIIREIKKMNHVLDTCAHLDDSWLIFFEGRRSYVQKEMSTNHV